MPEHVKISAGQFLILVMFFTIGSAILVIPSGMATIAKQDAWIAALLGVVGGLLLLLLYVKLATLYPKQNLIQIMETLLGKWVGKIVAVIFVGTLFVTGPVTVLYYVGNFLTTEMLPETPIYAANILFALIIIMGVRLGLEVLARTAELLFPFFSFLFIAFIVLVLPDVKLDNMLPILEAGSAPIWPATLSFLSTTYLTEILMLMIFPSALNRVDQGRKAFYIGGIIGGMLMALIVALTILVLGPDLAGRSIFPTYTLAKEISIGNFLQRIEAIIAVVWFISLFFRITMYVYAILISITHIFQLKDYRPLVLPLGMIMVLLSLDVYPNVTYQANWDARIWIPCIITMGLFLPILLLIVHAVRSHGAANKKKLPK